MSDHPIRKYVAKRQITVKVQYGKDLRKAKCFSSGMSTYVEVSLGSDTRKTKTQKKAGRDPKWYDEMIFNYDNEPHLEVKCWCENGCCGEKLVGTGYLNMPPPARINDHNVPLSFEGKSGDKYGLVNILVTFTDQGIEHLERDAAKDALKAAGVAMDPTGAPLKTAAAAPAAAPMPFNINITQNN